MSRIFRRANWWRKWLKNLYKYVGSWAIVMFVTLAYFIVALAVFIRWGVESILRSIRNEDQSTAALPDV
jgi:hypothetical protein